MFQSVSPVCKYTSVSWITWLANMKQLILKVKAILWTLSAIQATLKSWKREEKSYQKKIQAFSRVSSPLRNPGLATTHRPLSFSSSRWCSILLMCSSISCRHTTKTKLILLIIGQTLNIRGFGYGCQSHKCLRYFLKCWNLTSWMYKIKSYSIYTSKVWKSCSRVNYLLGVVDCFTEDARSVFRHLEHKLQSAHYCK